MTQQASPESYRWPRRSKVLKTSPSTTSHSGWILTGLKQANNTFQWMDNFSKIIGKHTVKVGGEFHLDQVNTHPDVIFNGAFLFQGTETGVDFADFLLGIASSYNQGDSQPFYNRNKYAGLFAQDNWRIEIKSHSQLWLAVGRNPTVVREV